MENINVEELNKKSKHIRNLLLDMCVKAETGHVTSSFSCTEIMVALYYGGILKFDPKKLSQLAQRQILRLKQRMEKSHKPLMYIEEINRVILSEL